VASRSPDVRSSVRLDLISGSRIASAKRRTIKKIREEKYNEKEKGERRWAITIKRQENICNSWCQKNKQLPCESGLATGGPTALECRRTVRRVRKDAIVDHPWASFVPSDLPCWYVNSKTHSNGMHVKVGIYWNKLPVPGLLWYLEFKNQFCQVTDHK
jgi:hypothetical protein